MLDPGTAEIRADSAAELTPCALSLVDGSASPVFISAPARLFFGAKSKYVVTLSLDERSANRPRWDGPLMWMRYCAAAIYIAAVTVLYSRNAHSVETSGRFDLGRFTETQAVFAFVAILGIVVIFFGGQMRLPQRPRLLRNGKIRLSGLHVDALTEWRSANAGLIE